MPQPLRSPGERGGELQLLCDTNDADVQALLDDAGVTLDESTCACVEGDTVARAVPRDESFCRDQFEDTDDERHAKARARVEAICGWDL